MLSTFKVSGYAPNGAGIRTTVSTSVVEAATVSGTIATESTHFLVGIQTNGVYVTFDGTVPSGTNGHAYAAGYQDFWTKQMIAKARWIRSGAADAAVHVTPMAYC